MLIASFDFSENNLLIEQLGIESLYVLPVFIQSLAEHQLKNFTNLHPDKVIFTECKTIHNNVIHPCENIPLAEFKKILLNYDKSERIFIYRNDCFFEGDFSEVINTESDKTVLVSDKNGFCFAIISDVQFAVKNFDKYKFLFNHPRNNVEDSYVEIVFDGNVKPLLNVKNYKALLFDVLNDKTYYKLPFVAEGVFVDSLIPEGDFSITPPVFLGDCVQIESGSNIGPNAVLLGNSLISQNSIVKNSVLFDNVYISSDCYADGAVFCDNSSLKRGAAVFNDSVIGKNSVIGENICVENGSLIGKNVRYDKKISSKMPQRKIFDFENKFNYITAEKAAVIGSGVGFAFKQPKVIVAGDGRTDSNAVKLAFIGGLMSSGAECFDTGNSYKSMIFFASDFCECDYSVFIRSDKSGVNIEIFNASGEEISDSDYFKLIEIFNESEFNSTKFNKIKNVRQIYGIKRMYVRKITSMFDRKVKYIPNINCENKFISKTVNAIFKIICESNSIEDGFEALFNNDATSLCIKYNGQIYSHKRLQRLAKHYDKTNYKKIDNLFSELWKKDAVVLLFKILDILSQTNKALNELFEEIPKIYVIKRENTIDFKPGIVAKKINALQNARVDKKDFCITFKNGFVKVKVGESDKKIKVFAAASDISFAKEICDFVSDFVTDDST